MLRIAFITLAARKSGMIGALAAVGLAVVLVVSCGILLQSSLSAPLPVERLQAASVVVQASTTSAGCTARRTSVSRSAERVRLRAQRPNGSGTSPASPPSFADRSVYAPAVDRHGRILKGENGSPSVGHGWESSALAPYLLTSGHAPVASVRTSSSTRTSRRQGALHVGDRLRILTSRAGDVHDHRDRRTTARRTICPSKARVFFRTDEAARLSGSGDRVDLLGIITRPGADPAKVADAVRDAT